jgi:hypothetical protein
LLLLQPAENKADAMSSVVARMTLSFMQNSINSHPSS